MVLSLLSSKGAKGPLERDMGTMGGRGLVLGRLPSMESPDPYTEIIIFAFHIMIMVIINVELVHFRTPGT